MMFGRKKEKIRGDDLTSKELPHNRWEVLFDLLKHQKLNLINLSLLQSLFAIPLFADIIVFGMLILGAYTEGAANNVIFSLLFYAMLIAIPCIFIMFIGFGGTFEVARRLIFQEGTILKEDFWVGIKHNIKKAIPMGIIVAISAFVAVIGGYYIAFFGTVHPIVTGLGIGASIMQFYLFSTIGVYVLALSSVYELTFREAFKNGFVFTFTGFFPNIGLFLVSVGLLVSLLLINMVSQLVSIFLFVFFIGLIIVGWSLYANRQFDKYINKESYPDQVGRGMYPTKDKEE